MELSGSLNSDLISWTHSPTVTTWIFNRPQHFQHTAVGSLALTIVSNTTTTTTIITTTKNYGKVLDSVKQNKRKQRTLLKLFWRYTYNKQTKREKRDQWERTV